MVNAKHGKKKKKEMSFGSYLYQYNVNATNVVKVKKANNLE